jgi:ABC-type uncharacterized transport system substrate-binding protein
VAHPHVFVDHSMLVRFGSEGLVGVSVHWTFDPFFSSVLVQSFDRNRDGRLSPEELKRLESDQTEKLAAVAYFLQVRVDGTVASVKEVRDFRIAVINDQVTYSFFVPLHSVNAARGTVEINIEDPTIYSWFRLVSRGPSLVEAPSSYAVECTPMRFEQSRNSAQNAIRCVFQKR